MQKVFMNSTWMFTTAPMQDKSQLDVFMNSN